MLQVFVTPPFTGSPINVGKNGLARVSFNLKVVETDTTLKNRTIEGTFDFGDGSTLPQGNSLFSSGSPLTTTLTKSYKPGIYQLKFHLFNYRRPVPDSIDYVIDLNVVKDVPDEPVKGAIFGPILPKDSGAPNKLQWNLDVGTDLAVIESSVKMLLITNTGDRIMLPDYGTNLRRMIFDQDTQLVETLAREDIVLALRKWEPRANLQSLNISRDPDASTISMDASFLTPFSGTPFQLSLTFTK
jgi:phage baseplate assembly protein W